jgi:hypothetical protein
MNPSAVIPFRFESNEVRTLNINGDPWFIARDVCQILGLENITHAVAGLDDDEKGVRKVNTPGGDQQMIIISESGLYTLIIRSNKPQAKPFRKWVTSVVLPAIRKTGSYALPGAAGKRADIFHHRGPASPGGLDIRYTLDLTKIITNPKPQALELLERLTGVVVTDLAADIASGSAAYRDRADIRAVIDRFAAAHLVAAPGESVLFKEVYGRFLRWYGDQGFDVNYVPSLKAMASWLDDHNFPRRKPCGRATIYGCILAAEVEQ